MSTGAIVNWRPEPVESFYESSVLEHEPAPDPPRFRLRLGSRIYPHMKLAIERSPGGEGHLFRADTHDQHCCPAPGSREYDIFRQLMTANREIAQGIESEWERQGLPTFKTYLKRDLQRRGSA